MSDVFISYARSTAAEAQAAASALRSLGYGVWLDEELPAHRAYADVIDERLRSAKAVLVIWSAEAVKSQWVRAEADIARNAGTLVQLNIDGAVPPLPFNQIQCADMKGWVGDTDAPGWQTILRSVAELTSIPATGNERKQPDDHATAATRKLSICVLPFANMSGDVEQEYFSDGISEDIITDLSKVSALDVIARNTSFQFKGKNVDVGQIARQLRASHILEGSVRKAGGRLRITAQLIDGGSGNHIWAERYDRDLNDIFALQDEISEAIVKALRLKLLPEEKRAIERRGTENVEAYNLYLMARQYITVGNPGDPRREEAIIRVCSRATEIDPNYADAWALMANALMEKRWRTGAAGDGGLAAAERALSLNADLAEAHAVKARILFESGREEEAVREITTALRLNPEAWVVNSQAAMLSFRQHRLADATGFFEKATALMETDFASPGMLVTTYTGLGDLNAAQRAAQTALARAERVIAQDRSNGAAMSFGASALGALGESERAKEWMNRGLLVDPDNINMRYNFACVLAAQLKDADAALDMLEPYFERAARGILDYSLVDPDLETVRDHPRFKAMFAAADSRLKAEEAAANSPKA